MKWVTSLVMWFSMAACTWVLGRLDTQPGSWLCQTRVCARTIWLWLFARLSAGLDEAIVRVITARPGPEPVSHAMAALTPSLIRAA